MAKKERLVPVTAYIPKRYKEELDAKAAEDPRETVSGLIDAAIRQYLQTEKKATPAHEAPLMHQEFVGV